MPSIGTSPSETNCYKCLAELQTEALKCARCNSHMHLRCSELPLYMLLRFKTSQSQYICQSCVLGEGSPEALKEAEENLIENMELEKAAIEEAAKAADDSISVVPEVADNKGPGKIRASVKNKAVCKYYLMRECQHGRLGKTCHFSHPKICVKFSKNGDRRGGCIKGKTCKDYHPQLCFESQDKHECSKRKCRFFHLNGTKKTFDNTLMTDNSRYIPSSMMGITYRAPTNRADPGSETYARVTSRANQHNDNAQSLLNQNQKGSGYHPFILNAEQSSFLLVDQRMRKLKGMVMTLVQAVKPPPAAVQIPGQVLEHH